MQRAGLRLQTTPFPRVLSGPQAALLSKIKLCVTSGCPFGVWGPAWGTEQGTRAWGRTLCHSHHPALGTARGSGCRPRAIGHWRPEPLPVVVCGPVPDKPPGIPVLVPSVPPGPGRGACCLDARPSWGQPLCSISGASTAAEGLGHRQEGLRRMAALWGLLLPHPRPHTPACPPARPPAPWAQRSRRQGLAGWLRRLRTAGLSS